MTQLNTDLREDKQYLINHPGATPITTAQVSLNKRQKCAVYILLMEIFVDMNLMGTFLGGRIEEIDWCCCLHRVQFQDSAECEDCVWCCNQSCLAASQTKEEEEKGKALHISMNRSKSNLSISPFCNFLLSYIYICASKAMALLLSFLLSFSISKFPLYFAEAFCQ